MYVEKARLLSRHGIDEEYFAFNGSNVSPLVFAVKAKSLVSVMSVRRTVLLSFNLPIKVEIRDVKEDDRQVLGEIFCEIYLSEAMANRFFKNIYDSQLFELVDNWEKTFFTVYMKVPLNYFIYYKKPTTF